MFRSKIIFLLIILIYVPFVPAQMVPFAFFKGISAPPPPTDPCRDGSAAIGDVCPGGGIYAGLYNGFPQMVTAGGCTDLAVPSCSGTDTLVKRPWSTTVVNPGVASAVDGAVNSNTMITMDPAGAESAKFCDDLLWGGYSDWYLPAQSELSQLYTNRVALGGFAAGAYWASTQQNALSAGNAKSINFSVGPAVNNVARGTSNFIRCVRKFAPVLVASPTVVTGLDVIAPASNSNWVTVTITNNGSAIASSVTTVVTGLLQKGTDGCAGQSIAAGQSCNLQVRFANASLNGAFSGKLTVSAPGSSVVVNFSGTGSGHGGACAGKVIGETCVGGGIYLGSYTYPNGVGVRHLMTTPGGCDGSANPTCSGGADTLKLAFGSMSINHPAIADQANGVDATAAIIGAEPAAPAAAYCDNMTYAGYTDWYLPHEEEFRKIVSPGGPAAGGFTIDNYYWISKPVNTSNANAEQYKGSSSSYGNQNIGKNTLNFVRCIRRY